MSMTKMRRTCEEAAHQHDRAAAHHRHSAKHLADGKPAAAAKESVLALIHSEKARMAETVMAPESSKTNDRTASEAAWHFLS